LPLAIAYAIDNNLPIYSVFLMILFLNILVIFFIFYFLDNLHSLFMKFSPYRKVFGAFIKRFRKKVDKFEERYESLGFLALVLFVAVPLPGTGAWTGCLLAWLLDLRRRESIIAISLGVIIAGILILLGTLGVLRIFG